MNTNNDCKTILYMIDFSKFIENSEHAIEKLSKVISVMKNAHETEGLKVIWHEQPTLTIYLCQKDPLLWDEYVEIRDQFLEEGWGEYDSFADVLTENESYVSLYKEHVSRLVDACTAYYGDPGWIANMFRNAKKPVMLQDYKL